MEATNKLPAPRGVLESTPESTPSKKAKSRWLSIKNYKLRTASSANLADLEADGMEPDANLASGT